MMQPRARLLPYLKVTLYMHASFFMSMVVHDMIEQSGSWLRHTVSFYVDKTSPNLAVSETITLVLELLSPLYWPFCAGILRSLSTILLEVAGHALSQQLGRRTSTFILLVAQVLQISIRVLGVEMFWPRVIGSVIFLVAAYSLIGDTKNYCYQLAFFNGNIFNFMLVLQTNFQEVKAADEQRHHSLFPSNMALLTYLFINATLLMYLAVCGARRRNNEEGRNHRRQQDLTWSALMLLSLSVAQCVLFRVFIKLTYRESDSKQTELFVYVAVSLLSLIFSLVVDLSGVLHIGVLHIGFLHIGINVLLLIAASMMALSNHQLVLWLAFILMELSYSFTSLVLWTSLPYIVPENRLAIAFTTIKVLQGLALTIVKRDLKSALLSIVTLTGPTFILSWGANWYIRRMAGNNPDRQHDQHD